MWMPAQTLHVRWVACVLSSAMGFAEGLWRATNCFGNSLGCLGAPMRAHWWTTQFDVTKSQCCKLHLVTGHGQLWLYCSHYLTIQLDCLHRCTYFRTFYCIMFSCWKCANFRLLWIEQQCTWLCKCLYGRFNLSFGYMSKSDKNGPWGR